VHFLCGYLGMALVFWLTLEWGPSRVKA